MYLDLPVRGPLLRKRSPRARVVEPSVRRAGSGRRVMARNDASEGERCTGDLRGASGRNVQPQQETPPIGRGCLMGEVPGDRHDAVKPAASTELVQTAEEPCHLDCFNSRSPTLAQIGTSLDRHS